MAYENFKVILHRDLKLWFVKVVKSDLREWRAFVKPVTVSHDGMHKVHIDCVYLCMCDVWYVLLVSLL